MDINHLRYVTAIAQTCSFSKAAELLFISQSSLSQQIMKLEKEIGYPLFLRTTKSVRLSPEGKRFLTQSERVLREFHALEEQVEATRASLEHTINLGVSMIYRPETSALVAQFIREHPEIDFNLISAWELEIVDMLHSGRIDIGLFGVDWENDDLSGMTTFPLHDEYVVAVVSEENPLAQNTTIQLEELARQPLIFTSSYSAVRRLVLQRLHRKGLTPAKVMTISETETRRHCVGQNLGVALAMNSADQWREREHVRCIPLEPRLTRTYSLVFPHESNTRHPLAVKQLQDFLLAHLR